jgi:hypothetical protein
MMNNGRGTSSFVLPFGGTSMTAQHQHTIAICVAAIFFVAQQFLLFKISLYSGLEHITDGRLMHPRRFVTKIFLQVQMSAHTTYPPARSSTHNKVSATGSGGCYPPRETQGA